MKNLLLLFSFLAIYGTVKSQSTTTVDPRIYDRYSESQVELWLENNPQKITALNIELEFGWKIKEFPTEELQNFDFLYYRNDDKSLGEAVTEIDPNNVSLFEYSYDRKLTEEVYYRIGNTNYVLVILSNESLLKYLNPKM